MHTRSGRQLLNKGKGASGTEQPWSLVAGDLRPSDPSNGFLASSSAWIESGNDLRIRDIPTTDTYFVVSGGDIIPKPI